MRDEKYVVEFTEEEFLKLMSLLNEMFLPERLSLKYIVEYQDKCYLGILSKFNVIREEKIFNEKYGDKNE